MEKLYKIIYYISITCVSYGQEQVKYSLDFVDINAKPKIGDIVLLRDTIKGNKWSISTVKDIKEGEQTFGTTNYLLVAFEDNEECWWSNVSVYVLPEQETIKNL